MGGKWLYSCCFLCVGGLLPGFILYTSLCWRYLKHSYVYLFIYLYINIFIFIKKKKLVTVVEGYLKALFSIATTPRCRGGRYSVPRIDPLYP